MIIFTFCCTYKYEGRNHMKITAEFELGQKDITQEYRKCILSFIKKCLSEAIRRVDKII